MPDLSRLMSEITATNIKTLRISMGLDQTGFADAMSVSQGTVSRWEDGSNPEAASLVKLAAAAKCSVAEFTTQVVKAPLEHSLRAPMPEYPRDVLLLPVQLPSAAELTEMFQSLLEIALEQPEPAAIARELARLLPTALAETVYRRAGQVDGVEPDPEAGPPAPARGGRAKRSQPRT